MASTSQKKLKAIGLDEKQIAHMPFDDSSPEGSHRPTISTSQIAALKNLGLMDAAESPQWLIDISYAWNVTFPANQHVHVEHSYQPFVAAGTASGYAKTDGKMIGLLIYIGNQKKPPSLSYGESPVF